MMAATPQPPLLRGQAAAPDGPADLSMMYVLHHGFRRDLARFAEAVGRTPADDRSTWQALLARWDLFALLLHDHHHKEDEILWPLLRDARDRGRRHGRAACSTRWRPSTRRSTRSWPRSAPVWC